MADEMEAMLALFNNPETQTSKKLKSRKQSFLLKFQLFTLIYQKKGDLNFNQIASKIRMVQYGFAFDIYNEGKERYFTYIVKGLVMVFVSKADDPGASPTLFRKMGANEHFGEKVLYGNNQKYHSAKSVSKTYVLQLDLQTFYKTFSGHFKYQQLREKVDFLKSIWIFKQTNNNQIERILLLSKPYRYTKNTILFKQGDKPEAVYVVIEGELTLFKRSTEPESSHKYLPFMILGKGEVCACEEVLEKSLMRCGGTVTTSDAVLLRIGAALFLDIFEDKINSEVLNERNEVKQKLIEVKSKKSIIMSLKKLKQTQKLLEDKEREKKPKQRMTRYITQAKQTHYGDIFDITKGSISWQNRLKNRKLREFTLNQKVRKQRMKTSTIRLSTMTNHSFTNDKELLLSYLIRKDRTERKADDWERNFQREKAYQARELVVGSSPAVKTQKRKLRQSRKKNAASMPTLM